MRVFKVLAVVVLFSCIPFILASSKGCDDDDDDKANLCPKITLRAAAYNSYSHVTGGGAWNTGTKDYVTDKYTNEFFCGETVSFLVLIDATSIKPKNPGSGETVQFSVQFPSPKYGGSGFTTINAYLNTQDSAVSSDGDSALTFSVTQSGLLSKYGTSTISVSVTNVEPGEKIVVRIDAKICCNDGVYYEKANQLSAKLKSAGVVPKYACSASSPKIPVPVNPYPRTDFCCDGDPCTLDTFQFGTDCKCLRNIKSCQPDSIDCTVDTCRNGECISIPDNERCDDGKFCTVEFCSSVTGCTSQPYTCPDDGDLCTLEFCDTVTDSCVQQSLDCPDDGHGCTQEICENGVCSHIYHDDFCDDGRFCTIDICTDTGCTTQPYTCPDDGDLCTLDVCDVFTDTCEHKTRTCNPQDICHTSRCVAGNCIQEEVVCPPQNCKVPRCDVDRNGCVYDDVVCPSDDDDCTNDVCNPTNGICEHPYIVCNDGIPCTINSCNPVGGCDYSQTTCSPNCEICNLQTGNCDPLCNPAHDCATFDHCDTTTGECIFTNFNDALCEGLICQVPVCTPQGCSTIPRVCTGPDPCLLYTCSLGDGSCVPSVDPKWEQQCDDGIDCTADICVSTSGVAQCANVPNDRICGVGFPDCFDKACIPGQGCSVVANPNKCPSSPLGCLRPECTEAGGCGFTDLCRAQGNNCACSQTLNDCVCSGPHK